MKKMIAVMVIGLLLTPNSVFALTEGKKAADQLREITVTSGVGLYADPVEQGRYVYRGDLQLPDRVGNANNFIKFNNELWYIVAVEADDILKIVKISPMPMIHEKTTPGSIPAREDMINDKDKSVIKPMGFRLLEGGIRDTRWFDSVYYMEIPGLTDWNSTIGTRYSSNPNDYCYNEEPYNYKGCNVWGSATTTLNSAGTAAVKQINGKNLPSEEANGNMYLNTTYYNSLNSDKEYIVEHLFNVGLINYDSTIAEAIKQEKGNTWKGKVGLLSLSDGIKASINENCENFSNQINQCRGSSTSYLGYYAASTLNPLAPLMNDDYYVSEYYDAMAVIGQIFSYYSVPNITVVSPAVYLTPCITLSGLGTNTEPYTISPFECTTDNSEDPSTSNKEEVHVPATDAFIPLIISCIAALLILIGIVGYYFIHKRRKV